MANPDLTHDDAALDHELAGLLNIDKFPPSIEFRESAGISDPKIYQEADADWQGWWASQAREVALVQTLGPGAG